MPGKRLGFLSISGACLLLGLGWFFVYPSIRQNADLSAAPPKYGQNPFEYTAAFDAEIREVGQISTAQFAARYPTPNYLRELSWDPTTAQFFDKLNVEKVEKEHADLKATLAKYPGATPDHVANIKRNLTTVLSGYKLSPDELAKYKTNGFVVSERLGGHSFGQVYYDVYSRDLPVFVSSDSVLHAWHRSYDAMLEDLELTYLKQALAALLAGMHAALPEAKARYGNGVLKNSFLDADYFLAVARSLQGGFVPTHFDQDKRVHTTLDAVAREGMHEFELFGRNRKMDFSQFKPRGHYEAQPELRAYFKAMMWCGRIDLRIVGGFDKTGPLSSNRELGSAVVMLDLLRASGKDEAWRQFDRVIQTFVGRTDSATFDDLARVTAAAKVISIVELKTDDDLKNLADAIERSSAGKQDVRSDVYISPDTSTKVSLPRSFTLLGQKFVVDSWVTSKVVFDDIMWDGDKVIRRVPSGLDVVFAALGNNHVVPDLVERMETGSHRFRDRLPNRLLPYQHNLAAVRNVLDGLVPTTWDESISMQWLKTLRTLSAPHEETMPEAMKTREWAMKQTNAQLASWSQLRHDSILYVKQSYTAGASCYYPAGFIEPVIPFWVQMEAMAKRSADLMERTPFPPAAKPTQVKQVQFLRHFAAQMGRLKVVAQKQLDRNELSDEERKVLEDVMQIGHQRAGSATVPKYTGWYPALFYRGPEDCMKWDALVADVHTDVPSPKHDDPGCVLHEGVGGVDLLVIAIDNGKDRVVFSGPTLSHYEFEMPGVARKTDREWKTELLDAKVPPRPDWTRGYLVPHADRKPVDVHTKTNLLRE